MMFDHFIATADGAAVTAFIETKPAHALVVVTTDWCVPCRLMKPGLHHLASVFALPTILVDGDMEQAFGRHYGVDGFPTLLFFRDGQHVQTEGGYAGFQELRSKIMTVLGGSSETPASEAELRFEREILAAEEAVDRAMAPASAALEPHITAVNPVLDAYSTTLRQDVEAGRMPAREARTLLDAERRRLYAPFQDKIDDLRAAQDAALLAYESRAKGILDTFMAIQTIDTDHPSMICNDGLCRIV